jgi:uroporphyrinogen decarboxylase
MTDALNSRERFLAACRREKLQSPPAWVMRQAGRYLPQYREVRAKCEFLTMVRTPELAAEVTCQPVRRFGMDVAVIFSDILVPAAAMGVDVRFDEGRGPSLAPAVRSAEDVEGLRDFAAWESTGFVGEAIRRVRAELGEDKAILGFCGAPWTLASYLVEGGSSRDFQNAKSLLYGDPSTFDRLCERIVDNSIPYLAMQVEAGADAVQLFDSWGGSLDAATWRRAILPHTRRLVAGARKLGVPVILYVNGAAHLLSAMGETGADVLGIDWRVAPADAIRQVGARAAIQGNLDPCQLFAPVEVVERETNRVLDEFAAQRGYIFNLGSGILPGTPVASMDAVFRTIRTRREACVP